MFIGEICSKDSTIFFAFNILWKKELWYLSFKNNKYKLLNFIAFNIPNYKYTPFVIKQFGIYRIYQFFLVFSQKTSDMLNIFLVFVNICRTCNFMGGVLFGIYYSGEAGRRPASRYNFHFFFKLAENFVKWSGNFSWICGITPYFHVIGEDSNFLMTKSLVCSSFSSFMEKSSNIFLDSENSFITPLDRHTLVVLLKKFIFL